MEKAGLHQFQALIKKYPPQPPQIEIDPRKDIAALPYTGGTTGLPKAAVLTHCNYGPLQAQVSLLALFEGARGGYRLSTVFSYLRAGVVMMLNGWFRVHTLVLFTTPDIDEHPHGHGTV